MTQRSVTSATLRGDYETADRIAARNLDLIGTAQVMARGKTPSACPHIEHVIAVERCTDGLHRLWLDGNGGLAQRAAPRSRRRRPDSRHRTARGTRPGSC